MHQFTSKMSPTERRTLNLECFAVGSFNFPCVSPEEDEDTRGLGEPTRGGGETPLGGDEGSKIERGGGATALGVLGVDEFCVG